MEVSENAQVSDRRWQFRQLVAIQGECLKVTQASRRARQFRQLIAIQEQAVEMVQLLDLAGQLCEIKLAQIEKDQVSLLAKGAAGPLDQTKELNNAVSIPRAPDHV